MPSPTGSFWSRSATSCPPATPFEVDTDDVDREISELAGPQLVVPISNARYTLNAANARWGSLYDALYGTDAIEPTAGHAGLRPDPRRQGDRLGAPVPRRGRAARRRARTPTSTSYAIADGALVGDVRRRVDQRPCRSVGASWVIGASADQPSAVLLEHHGLGIELVIDRAHPVGADDPAGIADVVIESAVTTIVDLEDSVAAVDGHDKVGAYRNWLGLDARRPRDPVDKGERRSSCAASIRIARTPTSHGARSAQARPFAAADPQRRPPDDHPGAARWRRQRSAGRHPRRGRVVADRQARSRPSRRPAQLTGGFGLRGQAEDARPRRGGPHRQLCSARSSSWSGSRRTPSRSGSWTRSGARRSTWPSASAPPAHGSCSSTPGSSTAPATRSTPRCSPGRWCARPTCAANVDQGLRGLERRHRAGVRPARPGPDRQGHVGDAGPHGRHARAEDRPSPRGRQLRVGAVADRGHAARHPLPPGRRARATERAGRADPGESRRPAGDPGRRRSATGPPSNAAPRSTTTCRASSATSCAGSTKASGARRFPTSTASR